MSPAQLLRGTGGCRQGSGWTQRRVQRSFRTELFWTNLTTSQNVTSTQVMRSASKPTMVTTVAEDIGRAVTFDDRYVYYAHGQPKARIVSRVALAGGAPFDLSFYDDNFFGLAVNSNAVFTNSDGTLIGQDTWPSVFKYSSSMEGGAQLLGYSKVSKGGGGWGGIAADETSVYWLELSNPVRVMKCSTKGCGIFPEAIGTSSVDSPTATWRSTKPPSTGQPIKGSTR